MSENPDARAIDMRLEVVVLPVTDADRAKHFYSTLGWRLDLDFKAEDGYRVIQMTPPSYASFSDPDGNGWLLQEVTARLSPDLNPNDGRFTRQVMNAIFGRSA